MGTMCRRARGRGQGRAVSKVSLLTVVLLHLLIFLFEILLFEDMPVVLPLGSTVCRRI